MTQALATCPQAYQDDCVSLDGKTYALTDYAQGRLRGWVRLFTRRGFAYSNQDLSLPKELLPDPSTIPSLSDWDKFDVRAHQLGVGGYTDWLRKHAIPVSGNFFTTAIPQFLAKLDATIPGWSTILDVIAPILPFAPLLSSFLTGSAAAAGGAASAQTLAMGDTPLSLTSRSVGSFLPKLPVMSVSTSFNPVSIPAAQLGQDLDSSILQSVHQALANVAAPVSENLAPLQLTIADAFSYSETQARSLADALEHVALQVLSGYSDLLAVLGPLTSAVGVITSAAEAAAFGTVLSVATVTIGAARAGLSAAVASGDLAHAQGLSPQALERIDLQVVNAQEQANTRAIAELEAELAALGGSAPSSSSSGSGGGWIALAFLTAALVGGDRGR